MKTLGALFVASYVNIFLRAFQQRNVAYNHYLAVMPISLCMAAVEVFTIAVVAASGFDLSYVISVGLGGGLGCISSMYVHNRMFKRG